MCLLNPIALRMAKTLWSFGHSECNRVKLYRFNFFVVLSYIQQGNDRSRFQVLYGEYLKTGRQSAAESYGRPEQVKEMNYALMDRRRRKISQQTNRICKIIDSFYRQCRPILNDTEHCVRSGPTFFAFFFKLTIINKM